MFEQKNQDTINEITLQQDAIVYCPDCSSNDVRKSDKMSGIVGIVLLFFGIPLPIYKREFHCFGCFRDFKVVFKNQ